MSPEEISNLTAYEVGSWSHLLAHSVGYSLVPEDPAISALPMIISLSKEYSNFALSESVCSQLHDGIPLEVENPLYFQLGKELLGD